jgi:enamine deaminase RidA (YjgF/YER057c/UK114 family)
MTRQTFTDGTPYETSFGYSRAVRVGNHVYVSGTVGWADGGVLVAGGAYEQLKQAIANVAMVLERAGAAPGDVVCTRVYITDASQVDDVSRAHREAFGSIGPATSLLVVAALAAPEMLVEIEAEAVVDS